MFGKMKELTDFPSSMLEKQWNTVEGLIIPKMHAMIGDKKSSEELLDTVFSSAYESLPIPVRRVIKKDTFVDFCFARLELITKKLEAYSKKRDATISSLLKTPQKSAVLLQEEVHYWILEKFDGKPMRLHHVINPGCKQENYYAHTVATNHFTVSERKRSTSTQSKQRVFIVYRSSEYDYEMTKNAQDTKIKGLQTEESGSIFNFFDKIGYDATKQRYTAKPVKA